MVKVSYMEIYMERIRDLLARTSHPPALSSSSSRTGRRC